MLYISYICASSCQSCYHFVPISVMDGENGGEDTHRDCQHPGKMATPER